MFGLVNQAQCMAQETTHTVQCTVHHIWLPSCQQQQIALRYEALYLLLLSFWAWTSSALLLHAKLLGKLNVRLATSWTPLATEVLLAINIQHPFCGCC